MQMQSERLGKDVGVCIQYTAAAQGKAQPTTNDKSHEPYPKERRTDDREDTNESTTRQYVHDVSAA